MRLHILSDLHQEFGEMPVPRVDCDCVVLAGDGHIHHSNDFQIGETRVLANPRAYPDKPNAAFMPDMVVEVTPQLGS